MAALVEDMLLLARLDAGTAAETRADVDLGHLVLEAVNDARVVDRRRRYQVSLPDDAPRSCAATSTGCTRS